MNELQARDVALVRAIETTDTKQEVLSADDRLYATRSARELAQWQAADSHTQVTHEHFLQQRAEQIIKRIGERTPSMKAFLARRSVGKGLSIGLPLLALVLGAAADRITDPHRVDLLSPPLLAIILWNLLVYVAMLLALALPGARNRLGLTPLAQRLSTRAMAAPRKLPHALAAALASFTVEWSALAAPLTRARLARTLHLAAALFALGALVSLYARGLYTQYIAGWESTFLDAGQVHAILALLFAPAQWLFGLQGFSLAGIEALRFSNVRPPEGGARWVHLYAATLALLVVLPRMLLAVIAHVRAHRLARRFPLDLGHPYFRKLAGEAGMGEAVVLRVLPYSFTIDEARDRGLAALAVAAFGEQARVMLRPSSAYGEEAVEQLREVRFDDPAVGVTALLFNLAATPEKENHGAFIERALRSSPRGIAVLVDESAVAERGGPAARTDERIALWQRFCGHHGASANVVNLLHPDQRPLPDAVITISKAP